MTNKFEVVISAVDKASKPIAKINQSFARMVRPLQQVNRSVANLGKNLHLDKFSKGMGRIAKMTEGLGLTSGLGGLSGGLAVAGIAAALSKLELNLGAYGTSITRLKGRTGVSFRGGQRLKGAAKLMGLDGSVVDNSLTGLADTLRSAQTDPGVAMLLRKLGINSIAKKRDGTPDVEAMLPKIAEAIAGQKNPATQAAIANALGIGDLLPMLQRGSDGLKSLADSAEKAGAVLSEEQIKKAEAFDRSMDELKGNLTGFTNYIGAAAMPAFQGMVDFLNGKFSAPPSKSSTSGWLMPWDPLSFAAELGASAFPSGSDAPSRRKISGTVVDEARLPLGMRNNNPGNLRNPGGVGFQRFATMSDGLRGMAGQLGRYYNRDGLDNISGIVSKYAPSSENNTGAYIDAVSKRTGFGAKQSINLNDPATLQSVMKAMITQEQGKAGAAIDAKAIGEAVAQALRDQPPTAKANRYEMPRVAFAMPTDGIH